MSPGLCPCSGVAFWTFVVISDVCMYVIFIRCDKRTSNNKHKKQSQNDIQHKAAKPKKLYHLTKLYKERMRKDFLWISVEYSGSWYECPRNLKLARFLAGGSKWFKACESFANIFHVEWLNISWQLLCLVTVMSGVHVFDTEFKWLLWN